MPICGKLVISPYILFSLLFFFMIHQLLYFLLIELFIILHELSHCLFAVLFNADIIAFKIQFIGVRVGIHAPQIKRWKKLIIYLAGPIFNLLIYLASIFTINFFNQNFLFYQASSINLGLMIFNLLPFKPLDGYNVLVLFFNRKL